MWLFHSNLSKLFQVVDKDPKVRLLFVTDPFDLLWNETTEPLPWDPTSDPNPPWDPPNTTIQHTQSVSLTTDWDDLYTTPQGHTGGTNIGETKLAGYFCFIIIIDNSLKLDLTRAFSMMPHITLIKNGDA